MDSNQELFDQVAETHKRSVTKIVACGRCGSTVFILKNGVHLSGHDQDRTKQLKCLACGLEK